MKKRTNAYWENRANIRMGEYHKESDETILKITNAYVQAIGDINKDINKIFFNYQNHSGLTPGEIRELLNSTISKKELDSIRSKIRYINDEEIKKYMMAQLNAKAYKARITRLEALKESIYINSKILAYTELEHSNKLYTNNIQKAYYTNCFDIQKGLEIGFNVAAMSPEIIKEVLKNEWSGKHFSERIWQNTDVLAERLESVITSGLMSGKNSRRMASELQELSEYGMYAAERLVRTETTYITNMAEIESYKESDIEKYIYVSTLDLRTSKVCREMDGKIIKVSKAIAGETLPPLHPYCRSTTRAYFKDMERLERRARDPETGKNYIIPGDMEYKEWYDKFVVDKHGEDKAESLEKMIKNKSADKKQYSKFKERLGNENIPKSFDKFQELKYNNKDEWNLTKYNYKLRNEVLNNPNTILKNADKLEVNENKYIKYLFDGENISGLAKGKAISSRLGYSIDNYREFDKLVKENIGKYPSKFNGDTPHGQKYEVNMVLRGLKNKQAKVKVGIMVSGENPKLTTMFIDKLKVGDLEYEGFTNK